MATNVPPLTFGPSGFVAPSQADVLAGVQADFNAAFGGGLNPSLATPQGQLATSLTAIIGAVNDTFVEMTNQMNPDFAQNRWQDALAEIYFLQRNPSEPTVVQALCTGGVGVQIPQGALAQALDGNFYTATDGGTIGAGGTVTLSFACTVPGPIACPAGTLTRISRVVPGWDIVTNPSDGIIGNNTETRSEFEERREASVAKNARGTLPSVLGAVLDVSGVLDAYVTENDTAGSVTIRGASLVAKSLYVAAVGGAHLDVATAIWSKKAPGCAYNGNTTVVVQDTSSGYSPPFPSYNVTYEIPPALPILYVVNINNNPQVPANAVTLIQNAIIAAFAGSDGGARARIGATLFASRYVIPVAALGIWAEIVSLLIGSNNAAGATFAARIIGTAMTVLTSTITGTIANGQTISADLNALLPPGVTIVSGSGTAWVISSAQNVGASFTGNGSGTNLTASAVTGFINAGDKVQGTGVPANTIILSQTSGTPGGAGVYVTSGATTASSAACISGPIIGATTAAANSVDVNINQVPTINANNIVVNLV